MSTSCRNLPVSRGPSLAWVGAALAAALLAALVVAGELPAAPQASAHEYNIPLRARAL
ncbi:MAG TPA: hypothetical protein VEG27_01515 [Usitatibacter sp.]|nr:hypothetical protein [Usitatibacter sp.]